MFDINRQTSNFNRTLVPSCEMVSDFSGKGVNISYFECYRKLDLCNMYFTKMHIYTKYVTLG